MSILFSYLLIPFIISMFLAINMGGSGTGPAFSAAYGANVIRRATIPGLFGIFVFLGAILAGKNTATTIGKELIDPELLNYKSVSIILFAVSISLLISNLFGIPQSTSQSTVMAVSAPAIYYGVLNTHKLFYQVIPTWFILPLISFALSYLIGRFIYRPIRKRGWTISRKLNQNPILKGIVLLTSLYVAFSIGSNNVANAAGPIATMTLNELNLKPTQNNFILVTILATLMIAPNFGIGSSLFGKRILENTGKEIILFGRIEAVIIAFISGSLLLCASIFKGIPTSLVQLNVAAIIGIGVAKLGGRRIFRKTEVNRFFVMWLIAPVIAFALSFGLIVLFETQGWMN